MNELAAIEIGSAKTCLHSTTDIKGKLWPTG